ncbi:hypothetical protein [Thermomonospora catenispora]|uniref:hypothetical protein n=1 Tax=Thermomonospora catenispora TaxID=2493090 RepID=UPI00112202BF|nr:hypothetical protein [Thermomonospora catenispora]TNY37077.1 hypothetical protein EIO00_09515 [Thermomonospora catenispora]
MSLSFPRLARRAAGEIERLLSSVVEQGQEMIAQTQRHRAEIDRLRLQAAAQRERAERLERTLAEQAAELESMRRQMRALIDDLNDRLLPHLDARIHETEQDVARLATRMLRTDQRAERQESRLATAERRLADLRERIGRLEQRTGIWRELQADVARLGEDVDRLRAAASARPGDLPDAAGRNGREIRP